MKFKIGDLVEVIFALHPELIGHVGRIASFVKNSDIYGNVWDVDGTDHIDGIGIPEDWLRKLPPKQGTTTWKDIQQITGWVPNKQGVES